MTRNEDRLIDRLVAKGVVVHRPEATILEDLDPERIEAGVEIYPGTTLRGRRSLVGAGSHLGRVGGGRFENVAIGRDCRLDGGDFRDCVIRDGVRIRAGAELREGSLLEEGCRAGRNAGFKMTILMPFVTAGSLVDFADALVAGGSGPEDFSEIGSSLALYNYSPHGDKFASLFGDVPGGIFLDAPRIFIGGQTQIISPVKVGFGAVIAAGGAVRRDVGEGRLYAEASPILDEGFVAGRYGALRPKLSRTFEFIGQLKALELWYRRVRVPLGEDDAFTSALNRAGIEQLRAGVEERVRRLDRLVERLPASIELHRARAADADSDELLHRRRIKEQRAWMQAWPAAREGLLDPPGDEAATALDAVADAARSEGLGRLAQGGFLPTVLRDRLDEAIKEVARQALAEVVGAQRSWIDHLPT